MWDGAKFTTSLSDGVKAPKSVGLALVEKVRGVVSFMCVEGEKNLLART
jgi:hypothetical protein